MLWPNVTIIKVLCDPGPNPLMFCTPLHSHCNVLSALTSVRNYCLSVPAGPSYHTLTRTTSWILFVRLQIKQAYLTDNPSTNLQSSILGVFHSVAILCSRFIRRVCFACCARCTCLQSPKRSRRHELRPVPRSCIHHSHVSAHG